jgi:HEPN domain-containing protein
LAGLLPDDISLPSEATEAVSLTSYAVTARYPGDYEEITEDMYCESIRIAQAMVNWAEKVIGKSVKNRVNE